MELEDVMGNPFHLCRIISVSSEVGILQIYFMVALYRKWSTWKIAFPFLLSSSPFLPKVANLLQKNGMTGLQEPSLYIVGVSIKKYQR